MCFVGGLRVVTYRCFASPLSHSICAILTFCPRHPAAYSELSFFPFLPPSLPCFLLSFPSSFSPSLFTSLLLLWGHCVFNKDPPLSQRGRGDVLQRASGFGMALCSQRSNVIDCFTTTTTSYPPPLLCPFPTLQKHILYHRRAWQRRTKKKSH